MQAEIIRRTSPPGVDLGAQIHPLLQQVLVNRGIRDSAEIDLSLGSLIPVSELGNTQAAASLLHTMLDEGSRILVVGDFDADGATSTALCVSVLRQLGADVDYLVPNRFDFGYGLTPEIVAVALRSSPQLIITVDNGIASNAGVALAKQAGVHVLVTDHHLPGDALPDADVIVNPNSPDESFPDKGLAGVGVIFYVMAALVRRLTDCNWFATHGRSAPNMADALDLVALGTIADVVPLGKNNRILVEQGLRRIRAGKTRPGILALCDVAKRVPDELVSSDLGFALGPRLNAAGRLEDMSLGIECLLTPNKATAEKIARELDGLNHQRREIEGEMKQQAMVMLEELTFSDADAMPVALALYQADWHQGVIGILASRVKEMLHRPVIAFASDGAGQLKGSARSIQGVHIRDVLDVISKQAPDLINKFGGHAMAAGLTIPEQGIDQFRELFEAQVATLVDADALRGSHSSDGSLDPAWLDVAIAEMLRTAIPWGQQFAEPCFDDEFRVLSQRIVGDNHLKMQLAHASDPGSRIDAIAFGQADVIGEVAGQVVHLVYQMDVNRYLGRESLQLLVRYLEPAAV